MGQPLSQRPRLKRSLSFYCHLHVAHNSLDTLYLGGRRGVCIRRSYPSWWSVRSLDDRIFSLMVAGKESASGVVTPCGGQLEVSMTGYFPSWWPARSLPTPCLLENAWRGVTPPNILRPARPAVPCCSPPPFRCHSTQYPSPSPTGRAIHRPHREPLRLMRHSDWRPKASHSDRHQRGTRAREGATVGRRATESVGQTNRTPCRVAG